MIARTCAGNVKQMPLRVVDLFQVCVGPGPRWGDLVDEIRQGDVVWIPPGQKHWHGAAPNFDTAVLNGI